MIAIISMVIPTAIGFAVNIEQGLARSSGHAAGRAPHDLVDQLGVPRGVGDRLPRGPQRQRRGLAPISGGEAWHSYHHADPTSVMVCSAAAGRAAVIRLWSAAAWSAQSSGRAKSASHDGSSPTSLQAWPVDLS